MQILTKGPVSSVVYTTCFNLQVKLYVTKRQEPLSLSHAPLQLLGGPYLSDFCQYFEVNFINRAAAHCYVDLIVKEADNNVKLIVLDRLVGLKDHPSHEKVLKVFDI